MNVKHYEQTEQQPVTMEGSRGCRVRWLVGEKERAPNFAMRQFEVAVNGHTPRHSHPYEHEVFVLEGEGVVLEGDREHPLSQGYTCPKGRSLGALHHHPKRLDGPLLRRDGRLVPVTWDELLDDLAARVGAALSERGPDAVGVYLGTGATFDANLYWAGSAFL